MRKKQAAHSHKDVSLGISKSVPIKIQEKGNVIFFQLDIIIKDSQFTLEAL